MRIGAGAGLEAGNAGIGSYTGVAICFAVAAADWVVLHGAHGIRPDFGGVDARLGGSAGRGGVLAGAG